MKRSDPRSGVILVTVLWSIALLSALAMAASVTFRGFAGVMAVERDRVQGAALLSAGLETAAGIIDTLGDAPLLDNEATVNLATGSVRSRLTDEGGRIDVGKAPAEVIAALLRSVGASQSAANDVAQRIVERRNPGNTPRPNVALGSTNSATGTPANGAAIDAGNGAAIFRLATAPARSRNAPGVGGSHCAACDCIRRRNDKSAHRATGRHRGTSWGRERSGRRVRQGAPQLSGGCRAANAADRTGATISGGQAGARRVGRTHGRTCERLCRCRSVGDRRAASG